MAHDYYYAHYYGYEDYCYNGYKNERGEGEYRFITDDIVEDNSATMLVDTRDIRVQQDAVRYIMRRLKQEYRIYYTRFQLSYQYDDYGNKVVPEVRHFDTEKGIDVYLCMYVVRLIKHEVYKNNKRGAIFFYLQSENAKRMSHITKNFYSRDIKSIHEYIGNLNGKHPRYCKALTDFFNILRKVAELGVRVVICDLRDALEYEVSATYGLYKALSRCLAEYDELKEYLYNGKKLEIIDNESILPSGIVVRTRMNVPNDEYIVTRHYGNELSLSTCKYERVPVYGLKRNTEYTGYRKYLPVIQDNTFMYQHYEALEKIIKRNTLSGETMIMTDTTAYIREYLDEKTYTSLENEIPF